MSQRQPVAPAPSLLEAFSTYFDPLFSRASQRDGFRQYLTNVLLPSERNKTLTGLANAEPVLGAQLPRVQQLQWFVSESTWDAYKLNQQRIALLQAQPSLAPTACGALIIDETGDRKSGSKTAHIGRQYLANLGKIDTGVVSVTSLWADPDVYYPLNVEPYTPAHWFERGKDDPEFRTKPLIAVELVKQALAAHIHFRAVVADSLYGEHAELRKRLEQLSLGYVLALKPSHAWWHASDEFGSLVDVARASEWQSAEQAGEWVAVEREFRDGHTETWWALEVNHGPYGNDKAKRAVVVTSGPQTLPEASTWYLISNLPAPGSEGATSSKLQAATLAEIVRLYALRMWVEQSYKQVKTTLGWAEYQVRSDRAIRRHWAIVCCAFTFCLWHTRQGEAEVWVEVKGGALPQLSQRDRTDEEEEKKTENPAEERRRICWPVALRRVRAWLEPWAQLWRYWCAWSAQPPPPALQHLLDSLWQGIGIDLYEFFKRIVHK